MLDFYLIQLLFGMLYKGKKNYYKRIYVGTGPILTLDAVNYKLSGNSVLMIDKSDEIGGAWKHIKFCDVDKIENAVHYLLPCDECYYFLEKILNLKLIGSYKKFFNIKLFNFRLNIPVNNLFSRLFFNFININPKDLLNIGYVFKSIFRKSNIFSSMYPANGSYELISKIIQLSKKSNLSFLMGSQIKSIKVLDNKVYLEVNKQTYIADELVISHGFLPPKEFSINNELIKIKEVKYLRGSLHINTAISSKKEYMNFKNKFSQIIFPSNSLIKYIHNLSQFIEEDKSSRNYKFIVVVAIKNEINKSEETIREVVNLLEISRLIPKSKNRKKEDFLWQDIYLPIMINKDLEKIKKVSNNIIRVMYTDELSKGIGLYSRDWYYLKRFCKKIF